MSAAILVPVMLLSVVGTAVLGLLSKWIDRKVTARVQWRVGPPWYQPFADLFKLLGKETIVPKAAKGTGFLLAPVAGFAATSVAAVILWRSNLNPETGFYGDIIVVLYLLTVPSLALILGGSASGNPHAAIGASREMKLILSYELPFVLAVLAAVVGSSRSLSLGGTILATSHSWMATVGTVIGFIVALMCTQAKLGLVPFDQAEAECEIMSGPLVEYSGPPLGLFYLTKAMLFALLPVFLITVFWGGIRLGSPLAVIAAVLKYVLILVVLILVRNTNPRLRIDHAMRFFWFMMTPLAILAVVLAIL